MIEVISEQTEDLFIRGDQWVMTCPECEAKDHLYIQPDKYLFICFRCGHKGSFRREVARDPVRWSVVRRRVEGGTALAPPVRHDDVCGGLVGVWTETQERYTPVRRAREYLQSRGVPPVDWMRYRVSVRQWHNRVWFPYWANGVTTYAVGRSLSDDGGPKTLELGGEKPLFGHHLEQYDDYAFIVEGVFDHMATRRSYALMGSTMSETQTLTLMSTGVKVVYVMLDWNAESNTMKVVQTLNRLGVRAVPVLWRGTRKDPADIGRVRMGELVDQIRTVKITRRPKPIYVRQS